MSTGFLSSSGEPRFLRSTNKYSINNQPCAKCWDTALTGTDTAAPALREPAHTHKQTRTGPGGGQWDEGLSQAGEEFQKPAGAPPPETGIPEGFFEEVPFRETHLRR